MRLYRRSPPGGATRLQLFRQWWGVEVCKAAFWPLLPADGVLWLDWPPGLEREHNHQEQLHAALPLLLSEHLHHHRKCLRQRLLWGPDARLARLWHGKWHLWVVFLFWALPLSSWRPAAVGLQGCAASVERWLVTNIGVVLGICVGVAVIEVPQQLIPYVKHLLLLIFWLWTILSFNFFCFHSSECKTQRKLKALRSNMETNLDENNIKCCSTF